MSKVAVFWIFALSSFCAPVFADWAADAKLLDQTPIAGGQPSTNTTATINSLISGLDTFQPPQPCVDTSTGHQWPIGGSPASPATLTNCAAPAPAGTGTSGGNSATTTPLQQSQPSDNSGIMY